MTATIDHAPTSRWLPFPVARDGVRLYCLPHAGGSASAFRSWIGRLDGVAICPVQPAGRETRLRDEPHVAMPALVTDLADFVIADAQDGPYAVYGHSLGALVGFELLQEIRGRGGRQPVQFIVSGCSAPQWDAPDGIFAVADGVTDEKIVELLRALGGTPELFLTDPRVLRMILPPLRADLTIKNAYRYEPRPPLEVPITAIAATEDPRASVESILAWRDHTVRRFRTHTLDGGHFAVLEQADTVLDFFRAALRSH